jgi:hypothetical protein
MNKKDEKELVKLLEGMIGGLKGTVDNQKDFVKLLDRIIDLISYLMKSTAIIFFALNILIWRVFLWDPFNSLLGKISERWILLSENYKILILGFIGTIIAGVIAHILGSLFLEKIKSILKNNK